MHKGFFFLRKALKALDIARSLFSLPLAFTDNKGGLSPKAHTGGPKFPYLFSGEHPLKRYIFTLLYMSSTFTNLMFNKDVNGKSNACTYL